MRIVFFYLKLLAVRLLFSGGAAVASSKPRVMLRLLVAAVGGGLIGAFLSMFFMQVSYEDPGFHF